MNTKGPRQLYHKLFGIYTAIILGVVVVLVVFFLESSRARTLDTNQDYIKMLQEKSVSYLRTCSDKANLIQNELHDSEDILRDLLFYLSNDEEAYQRYRLDHFTNMASFSYDGFDGFTEKVFKANEEILHIDYISYKKEQVTVCYPNGKKYINTRKQEYMEKIKNADLAGDGEFAFLKEIRVPETLENTGCMVIYFPTDRFLDFQSYYDKPDIIVLNQGGTLLAASTDKFNLKSLLDAEKNGTLEAVTGSYAEAGSVEDYTVFALMDKRAAKRLSPSLFLMILGSGAAVTAAGELLISWYLGRLKNRLNYILEGMKQVTVGDLTVRLKTNERGDELDLISANFNEMCQRLDRYIQKSYLAEIEQKNAEMEVLQNQINPHFLYNTLEAIRMKAICNKDRDVAKMLYSMAVIFRSQLKDADVITLVQELHYCKKYLELFEYRYQGKFTFQLECPEEYMNEPVIKFIVQPVLENYFAHGICGEREGNEIKVYIEKTRTQLRIHVEDNGCGMAAEQLENMNRTLKENRDNSKKSIGLINVNRRLKAVYGKEYGVELRHGKSGGLHVILKVGTGGENGEETGNAGRG